MVKRTFVFYCTLNSICHLITCPVLARTNLAPSYARYRVPETSRFDSLFATARSRTGILDSLLNRFAGLAGALLNASQQFFLFAFDELKIVIRELAPLLLQLALSNVPVAFNLEFVHKNSFF
jgi:hypothetical protein